MNNGMTLFYTYIIINVFVHDRESTWEIKLSNEQNNNGNHSILKKKQY